MMRRLTAGLVIGLLAGLLAACEPPEGMEVHHFELFLDDSAELHRWKVEHSTYGDGNNELQHYRPQNLEVADDTLTITARRESYNGRDFTSGFIGSRGVDRYYPKFGRYEIRARLPHGQGLWPAFWLRRHGGAGYAEVDVMEYFHAEEPGQVRQTVHLSGDRVHRNSQLFESPRPDAESGWHTWAVDIVPEGDGVRFTFYQDDEQTGTYLDSNPTWNDPSIDPDAFWDIAVNLAVGGNWTGHPDDPLGHLFPNPPTGQCSIGWNQRFTNFPDNCPQTLEGQPIRRAEFPAVMEVDYVKVYRWVG